MKLVRPSRLLPAALVAAVALAPALAAQGAPRPAARAAARPPAPKAVQGATVEGITEYTLPNGLRVLLFPDQSKPTVTVNVTYFVGSRHEAYGETGMAHLLEHLVFKGTPKYPNIPQELTRHGARPNGTTWFDRTNYFETMQATDENLAWALDMEADRMVNSFIAKKDLESEFSVVRNEFELGENDPTGVLLDKTLAVMFQWHNYGKTTIGARSDIENVPIERLQAFYRKYYQPDNAMLVVAGKFDPAKTLRLVESTFGRIPRPKREGDMTLWPTYTREPVQDGERTVTVRRVGDVQLVGAAFKMPAGADERYAAVDVLTHVLVTEPAGRLYQALVEPKKAARVFGFNFQLREPGVLLAWAQLRRGEAVAPARDALLQALADVAGPRPVTDEEVARAKAELLKQWDLTYNDPERVALVLSETASWGDWRLLHLHRDRIRRVTAADVNRLAADYLKPDNRTVALFVPTDAPDRAPMPAEPDVAAMVKDYAGDVAVAEGEAFDPSPLTIESRVERFTVSNGLQMALLPKKTRGERVNLQLTLRLGDLASLTGQREVADMTADLLLRGTFTKTRQQVKDEFDRLKAQVSIGSPVAGAVSVRLETTRPNLVPALQLLGEVLRSPAFDAKELDLLRQENLASIEEQRSEPTQVAVNAYQRATNPYPKGDPRATPSFDESIEAYKAVTVTDVKRFYAEFYGAQAAQLAVVGDFDAKDVKDWAAERLAGWAATRPVARVPSEYRQPQGQALSIETPDKANAMFVAGHTLPVKEAHPDYPALALGNFMLGGGFLNSRLATRIRQKEGISYGVGSQLQASPLDDYGMFLTFAIYAPENAARLEAAFREELERALKEGFTADEIREAKAGWLQGRTVGRAQDGLLVTQLANAMYYGRTLAFDLELEKAVQALGPDQIREAMAKYLDPNRLTVVKAGDFAKGKPASTP